MTSFQFEDFKELENNILLILSPFTYDVDNAPSDVQLDSTDMQSDALLEEHFRTVSLLRFCSTFQR